MGITSAWSISAHDDDFIGTLAPRLLPLIAAERDEPLARERWERWRREPLPDFRTWWKPFGESCRKEADALESFLELTASGKHVQKMYDGLSPDDDFSLLTNVWELAGGAEDVFLSVQSTEFALRSFFHAIGPDRAVLLPGWCGNFLLTSAEVRETLPAVQQGRCPDLGRLGIFVDIGSGVGGFVDVLLLPQRPEQWPSGVDAARATRTACLGVLPGPIGCDTAPTHTQRTSAFTTPTRS
ncbi:hypothetical protein [Streptomyces collinus]|uniref:hypothetical protein n=1 Tax=Streptomyces collinus TaxID=42684 RepID=UPI00363CEC61